MIRVGTRGSKLALAQTGQLAAKIKGETELVEVTTTGDTSRASLVTLGGAGVFVSALRDALLAGQVDVVVHSMKDLPVASMPGIVLAAVAQRADARDVLCARDGLTLSDLAEGSRIGTGSPRRAAQLLAERPDLEVVDIRGNVESRLARVFGDDADLDAVVLAQAGLLRLGFDSQATELLELSRFPSAPAQGALAVEVREGDDASLRAVQHLDHAVSRACTLAERLVLGGLEAGCHAPVGATAIVDEGMLFLTATAYSSDGAEQVTASHAATLDSRSPADLAVAAEDVAGRAVAEMIEAGAMRLVHP